MHPPLPIRILICTRQKALGLSKTALAQRLGYRNKAKGIRRLDQVCDGQINQTDALIRALPEALEVEPAVVDAAITETEEQLRQAREQAWLASFVPHAVILTERTTPEPIFVAAVIGVDRILRIDFDLSAERATFVHQAINGIRARVIRWNRIADPTMPLGSYLLPAFGKPTGFVINYEPDRAVRFDLDGRAVAILRRAVRIGNAKLFMGPTIQSECMSASWRKT